jgi:hypothetical protein
MKIKPFKYSDNKTPDGYVCEKCKVSGVKLYREYNVCFDYQTLLCAKCSAKEQDIDLTYIDNDGKCTYKEIGGIKMHDVKSDVIGSRIPAVPIEDGDGFWGYTSVPDEGCNWWKNIPTFKEE